MDKYILQLKVKKWAEACQFLKSEDVKNAMDPEEWSAIEILSKKWQTTSYSQLMVDECNEMIEVTRYLRVIATTATSSLGARSFEELPE